MDTHSQVGDVASRTTIDDFLSALPGTTQTAPPELWGFGGLHGGLALAAMARAMHNAAGPEGDGPAAPGAQPLRSVTGRLHRAVRGHFRVEAQSDAATRSTTSASARIMDSASGAGPHEARGSAPLASATALFGSAGSHTSPPIQPAPPAVPSWHEGTLFTPPPSLVPVSEYYELRVSGTNRPFAGGSDPRLTAWVRLTEDDLPPDELRLLFLVDALAPSYAATLSAPQAIPTVELAVHFSGARATSPWVLVDAHTTAASGSGWISETINTWGEDGAHLAEARQLRLVRPAQAS